MSQQPPQQEQGFALTEVLVAILITTFFVAVSMQALVIAAIFKARAQETAEATTWIQEDLENIKYSAATLQYTSLSAETIGPPNPTTGLPGPPDTAPLLHESTDRVLHVASVEGFRKGDALKVGTDSTYNTIINQDEIIINGQKFKAIDPVNKTIILTNELGTIQPRSALVVATTRCSLGVSGGFADGLRDLITDPSGKTDITTAMSTKVPVSVSRPSKLTKKEFTMSRTISSDTAPYNILKLSYSVAPPNAHTTLTAAAVSTTSSLSVISAAGFKAGDKLTVGTDTDNKIASISGTTITLTSQLGTDQPKDSIVDASVASFHTEIIPNAAFQCP